MPDDQRPLAGEEFQRRRVCFRCIHVQGTWDQANGERGFRQADVEGFVCRSHALTLGRLLSRCKRKAVAWEIL
jgi:hypothetical protein